MVNSGILLKSSVNPTHTHQPQTHTEFLLLWGFSVCGAAEYTEIRCNCEPLSTAGTVDHMKHVASCVDTKQGCTSWWNLDCCCAVQAGEMKQLQTLTGEITLYIYEFLSKMRCLQFEKLEVLFFWRNDTSSFGDQKILEANNKYFTNI